MGKAEKGTPKDLANRMKAKGLQKLRWYCQMCEKQCRDENGFKCHTMSESHQRQLLLFAEDPDKFLDSFSEEFLEGYLSLLKRRFGTKRVHANNVYQEYIQDRDHIHMNATQWETLTDFVKWLGREGKCVVDETEKGWYVAYIDRDPETLRRQELMKKKEKFEKDEEDRMQEFINKQIELGLSKSGSKEEAKYTELQRDEGETVAINLKLGGSKQTSKKVENTTNILKLTAASTSKAKPEDNKEDKRKKEEKKRSALAQIMEEEMRGKKHKLEMQVRNNADEAVVGGNVKSPWLEKNIVVKVITKDLGSKFYKQKGVVRDIVDRYIAVVKLLDCGTKMKLDQEHLETVIPATNRKVLILAGKHRGNVALLKSIQEDQFSATLELEAGHIITNIPYENFSKLSVT
ncbi:hypothetical protein Pcinc_031257 [Petrolisthes cinctipes]|uniref:DNA/RNA-binding protein Kin17 WH-like domain-containing protein n=1 Tax=Petrolisthes cinctipes TaxID=88211 RepID=A0AAE1EWG9_PETCI|nr:hypothetical protein Pcinc_031257 [Petrolisthes cinctipes]